MNQISESIQRLANQEEGAAMTEFAITLPIFLFFFGALIGLGSLTHAAIDAHTNAASPFWQQVYAAEDDNSRLVPGPSYFPSGTNIPFDTGSNSYLAGTGHWGESASAVEDNMPEVTGRSLPANPVGDEIAQNMTDNPTDIIGDSRAAHSVAFDAPDHAISLPTLGGFLGSGLITQGLNMLTSYLSFNLGYGANMRYGSVQASHVETASLPYGLDDVSYNVSYSSLVSPTPDVSVFWDGIIPGKWKNDPEARAWTTSRLWVETEPQYRNLFAIYGNSDSDRLNRMGSNSVPSVYDDDGSNPNNPGWCFWCP